MLEYTQSVLYGTNGILTSYVPYFPVYIFDSFWAKKRLVSYLAVPYSLSLMKTYCVYNQFKQFVNTKLSKLAMEDESPTNTANDLTPSFRQTGVVVSNLACRGVNVNVNAFSYKGEQNLVKLDPGWHMQNS